MTSWGDILAALLMGGSVGAGLWLLKQQPRRECAVCGATKNLIRANAVEWVCEPCTHTSFEITREF
jgi:hypothetical protein